MWLLYTTPNSTNRSLRPLSLPLPRNKHGVYIPSSDTPHTQLGIRKGSEGNYPQTREWGYDGKPVKTTDWTDHGRAPEHTNPHDHPFKKNPTGGSYERGDSEAFKITTDKKVWEH